MSQPVEQAPAELSFDDALAYAMRLHQKMLLEGAETLYGRLLEAAPDHPDVLHFLGMLYHQTGRSEQAIAMISRAIEGAPTHPDLHNNLGNVLAESGRPDLAERAFLHVLELRPASPDTLNNLGVICRLQRRDDEAKTWYERAIEADPGHVNAHNNLGLLYGARGEVQLAVQYYCKAITLMPTHPDGKRLLGIAYYSMGKIEEAAEVFRQWHEESPDDPTARHMLAACTGENVPERAADDYIEYTFDRFANRFDEQLQQRLSYKAPELVVEAVARRIGEPAAQLDALDAGCGTGLCGPLLRPYARTLTGIDLSSGMLLKAQGRGYDKLEKAELTAWLEARSDAFDLIVSADTLVYFGALERVAQAAAGALRQSGLLAFTVEDAGAAVSDTGYQINPHGRYAHSEAYVQQVLAQAGLATLECTPAVLRTEGGEPVHGIVVVARKGD
jgi:predicted TPR repeat methyltransferase